MSELRGFERSLPMALMRAREAIMSKFRPILTEHDLTEQQWRVLRALADSTSACAVGELADQTFLLGPSLSRILVALEDRGLISRTTSSTDARSSVIDISSAGKRLVDKIAPKSEAVYKRIDETLSEGELEVLYDLLARTAAID